MKNKILVDKIDNQRIKNYLKRDRINRMLTPDDNTSVFILNADSGFGKTRALQDYTAAQDAYIVWIGFTDSDNYPSRFWTHFFTALNNYCSESLDPMYAANFPSHNHAFELFVQELKTKRLTDKPVLFVFDDYQNITNINVLNFISKFLLVNIPDSSFYILTRYETEEMTYPENIRTITAEDLMFTLEETRAYFKQKEMDYSQLMIKDIYNQTKGWPFAVYLLSLAADKNKHLLQHHSRISKQFIFDIIDTTMFSNYSIEAQNFMVAMSLVEFHPVKMIEDLFSSETDKYYEALANNIFIRYNPNRNYFHTHQLFREFLDSKQHMIPPQQKKDIYNKTGDWFYEHELLIDALNSYQKAGNHDMIWSIISQMIPGYFEEELVRLLLKCLQGLPDSFTNKTPLVYIAIATLYYWLGDMEKVENLSLETIERMNRKDESELSREVIGNAYIILAFCHMRMGNTEFKEDFISAGNYIEGKSRVYGKPYMYLLNTHPIVLKEGEKGELENWVNTLKAAEPYYCRLLDGGLSGLALLAEAMGCYYQGLFDQTEEYVLAAIYSGKQHKQYDIVLCSYFLRNRVAAMKNNHSLVKECFDEMRQYGECFDEITPLNILDTVIGALYVSLNMNHKIPDWIIKENTYHNSFYNRESGFEGVIRVYALFNEGRFYEAVPFLKNLEKDYADNNEYIYLLHVKIMLAISYYHTNQINLLIDYIYEAYEMSVHNAIIMPFVSFGKYTRNIFENLQRLRSKKHTLCAESSSKLAMLPAEWINNIVVKSSTFAKKLNVLKEKYLLEFPEEKDEEAVLNERERQTLLLVSEGYTRSEIADSMEISINTVKSLLNSSYAKLGAINSPNAVRIAMERNII